MIYDPQLWTEAIFNRKKYKDKHATMCMFGRDYSTWKILGEEHPYLRIYRGWSLAYASVDGLWVISLIKF